jgi:hypothetical protein
VACSRGLPQIPTTIINAHQEAIYGQSALKLCLLLCDFSL